MKPLHRILLAAGIFFAAYYGCVFWYAARYKSEQTAHLLWSFPLPSAGDLCADPLSDGTVVASGGGIVYWVKPDGTQRAKYDPYASAYARAQKRQVATKGAGKANAAAETKGVAQDPQTQGQPLAQQQGQGIVPPPALNQFQYQYGYPGTIAWAAGAGDLLFISTQSGAGDPAELAAVDADGKEKWVAELPSASGGLGWIGWSDKFAYAMQSDGTLTQFSLDGRKQWSKQPLQAQGGMTVGPDGWVYVSQPYSNFMPTNNSGGGSSAAKPFAGSVALDETGKERWRLKNTNWQSDRAAIGADGTAYFLDNSGGLTAISREGKTKWSYSPSSPRAPGFSGLRSILSPMSGNYGYGFNGGQYNTPVIAGDAVCYLDPTGRRALAVGMDGALKWSRQLPADPLSLAASKDGSVYVTCGSFGVIGIGSDGRIRWRCRAPHDISSAPSVAYDGRVYVEADQKLYCFSP